jgi:ketosteroid isomerase-like protein
MSEENVALLRQAYDAYNRHGVAGILDYLDPEIEWRNPPESPDADVFVGHAGVLEWQRMVDGSFRAMNFEPQRIEELLDGRLLALVRFRFRAHESEIDVEVPITHLIKFRDGKATAFSFYTTEAAARDAARLPG